MTLMTNDLNDHFLGGREKGETQNRRRFSLLPTGDRREKREKKN